jgi:hypothetical protein
MRRVQPHYDLLWIAGFALLAFLGCLVLLRVGGIYVSPDETANAFFAKRFSEVGTLVAYEPLNLALDDALHPRSVVSFGGRLLPGSFIGLPVLYGAIATLVGNWSLPLLTPFIAALAVFAWFAVVKRIFDREIALLSAILLAVHPAWWYYSARSLMHNVLFAALLVFAAYFLVARPSRGKKLYDIDLVAAGLFVGLAMFVRPSEALWLAAAAAVAWIAARRMVSWRQLLLVGLSAVLALTPMFFLNRATYGNPLATGYRLESGEVGGVGEEFEGASQTSQTFQTFQTYAFPFGLSLKDTAKNTFAYGFGIFWWLTVLTVIGLPLAFPTRASPAPSRAARRSFLAFAAMATVYLAFMYGSWTFFDNPDPTSVTIGNSHVRYWLPVFVLTTPLSALAVIWLSHRAGTETARKLAVSLLVVVCLGLSVRVAFFSPEDGLVQAADELAQSREIRDHVLELTEEEAVIVVDRADKIFWPERRVVYPLRDDRTYALLPRLVLRVPLYYYGITLPPQDVEYLNTRKLAELGLQIDAVETFDIETLYRIERR